MNIEDGALWFNPKSEKLYQQKNAKWEEQPDFEKQNMHVPILAEEYLNRLYKIKKRGGIFKTRKTSYT